jgi:hypothetical protein
MVDRVREIVEAAAKPWVYVEDAGDGHPATYGLDSEQIAANILQALDDAGYEVALRAPRVICHCVACESMREGPDPKRKGD